MSSAFDEALRQYDYELSPELIANKPAHPRDSAKLVVLHRATGNVTWSTFHDIAEFLPPRSLLVLNETKVIPARLTLTRATGGHVSILRLKVERGLLHALSPKALRVGEHLKLAGKEMFVVDGRTEEAWLLRPLFPVHGMDALFRKHGTMPIPPYIKKTPLTEHELRREYQAVFAKKTGSIAAPTASLHFTTHLLHDLEKSGVECARITLHVHLGTFAPLTEDQWSAGALHPEEYHIGARAMQQITHAKREGRPIIAVGTTALRTLESAADSRGHIVHPEGTTQLFIREGHRFRITDGLITNFHVPQSSLLMLVSAFAGREKIFDVYREAMERKFRFFSFGDAMLII
ncbi:tRNA preQ1(34) S-adenosylmethionine ribosyltransferase-isomerase QueA [Candidatus Uhrbacteria bacterium]|nr:tRNA preQ1(34) S-adenosylmethionine ribosyltransferase-isomerase QueA [Candidatus Uhrbacteria bacterium]